MKSQKKRTPAKKPRRPKMNNEDTIVISGSSDSCDTITVDLGNYADTIDIGNITLDPSVYSVTGGSMAGSSITWTQDYTTWSPNPTSVHIDADGLTMKEGADIKIGGKSLMDAISKIEDRLAILHPNAELEGRWEQLKDLRRQYEELEKDILEKEKLMKILKET